MELQLSLHNIETGLRELASELAEAETPEQIEIISDGIQKYLHAEIKKCDGIADFCLHLDHLCHKPRELQRDGITVREICEIDREIERLQERRGMFRKILYVIKDMVKFELQALPWKEGKPRKIEGVRHTISLRGNGGKQAVVVTDESLVPDELCNVTVSMTAIQWRYIDILLEQDAGMSAPDQCEYISAPFPAKRTPNLSRISDELNKPCLFCRNSTTPFDGDCPECQGTGRNTVAGARLEERGESVHIS